MSFLNLGMALVVLACKTGFLTAGLKMRRLVLASFVSGLVLFLSTFFRPALPSSEQHLFAGLAGGALLLIYLGWIKAAKRNWLIQALLFTPYMACLIFAGLGLTSIEGAREIISPFKTTLLFMLVVIGAGLSAKKIPGMINTFNQGLVNLGLIIIFLLLFLPGATRALVLQARPLDIEMQINVIPLQFAMDISAEPLETVLPGPLVIFLAAVSVLVFSGYLSYRLQEWLKAR